MSSCACSFVLVVIPGKGTSATVIANVVTVNSSTRDANFMVKIRMVRMSRVDKKGFCSRFSTKT